MHMDVYEFAGVRVCVRVCMRTRLRKIWEEHSVVGVYLNVSYRADKMNLTVSNYTAPL